MKKLVLLLNLREHTVLHKYRSVFCTEIRLKERIFFPHDVLAVNYLKNVMPEFRQACIESSVHLDCYFDPILKEHSGKDNGEKPAKQEARINSSEILCDMPWRNLTIDAIRGGMVYPECLCDRPVGNILTDTVEQLWNGEQTQEYRRALLDNDRSVCSSECFRMMKR